MCQSDYFLCPLIFSVEISVGARTNYDRDLVGLKLGAGAMVGYESSCQDVASVVRLNQLKKYALYEICQLSTKHERSIHFIQQASSSHSHTFIKAHFSTCKCFLSYSHTHMNKSGATLDSMFCQRTLGTPKESSSIILHSTKKTCYTLHFMRR